MATLNFTITASEAEFKDFADRLGYMTVVTTGIDGQGQPINEPNPESRTGFLQRVMKEVVSQQFYTPFVRDIESGVRDTKEAEKEAMRVTVRDRVGVSYIA
jgi:hypothetical protein